LAKNDPTRNQLRLTDALLGALSTETFFRSRKNRDAAVPTAIAIKNATSGCDAVPIETSAGPGQYPESPHPTPNIAAPTTRREPCRCLHYNDGFADIREGSASPIGFQLWKIRFNLERRANCLAHDTS
jgi:hypothetical protein